MDDVTTDDIEAAFDRIRSHVRSTPVVEIDGGLGEGPVVLKLELLQHTGSFKPRGAFNRVLTHDVPPAGIVAASGGNHAAAVAHVAVTLGVAAHVFVPASSPSAKIDRLRRIGPPVEVTVVPGFYDDSQSASDVHAAETGALVVHPYDMVETIAGQGTCGRELDLQVDGLDTVLVTVGGGGFIAGIATWFGDRVKVVAVEPETSCCLHAALQAGNPQKVEVGGIAADSTGASRVGGLPFAIATRFVDASLTVSDDDIAAARQALWRVARIAAEPGGACAVAALTSGSYRPAPGERVAAIVCGGNADPGTLTL